MLFTKDNGALDGYGIKMLETDTDKNKNFLPAGVWYGNCPYRPGKKCDPDFLDKWAEASKNSRHNGKDAFLIKKSFLVCRRGGVIFMEDNGQNLSENAPDLLKLLQNPEDYNPKTGGGADVLSDPDIITLLLTLAGTLPFVDGPLPFGDILALLILGVVAITTIVDNWDYIINWANTPFIPDGYAPEPTVKAPDDEPAKGEEGGEDDAEKKNTIPDNPSITNHIFRPKEGHFPDDTPENRKKIEDVANDPDNYQGTDRHGKEGYSKTNPDGSQTWAEVRNGQITNGGINEVPRPWNPRTGFVQQPTTFRNPLKAPPGMMPY
jgi:hypothetical protein